MRMRKKANHQIEHDKEKNTHTIGIQNKNANAERIYKYKRSEVKAAEHMSRISYK